MKRRPRIPAVYQNVSGYNAGGVVTYMAHLIDQAGNAYELGDEEQGVGGNPQNHPDQVYWNNNRNSIRNALNAANGSIERIEIDCTLQPCDGQFAGCLYQVPLKIKAHLDALKATRGFNHLANIDTAKVPLRIFSHRVEDRDGTIKVIFCCVGDSRPQLTAAYAARDAWLWVDYNNQYIGPNVANGNRVFRAGPNLA